MAERKWNNPVRSQMGGKVPSTTAPQAVSTIGAPFDKPHDTGNGGIPLKMMENLGAHAKVASTITPAQQGGMATVPASGPTRGRERASAPKNQK